MSPCTALCTGEDTGEIPARLVDRGYIQGHRVHLSSSQLSTSAQKSDCSRSRAPYRSFVVDTGTSDGITNLSNR